MQAASLFVDISTILDSSLSLACRVFLLPRRHLAKTLLSELSPSELYIHMDQLVASKILSACVTIIRRAASLKTFRTRCKKYLSTGKHTHKFKDGGEMGTPSKS